jgi:hypothetical protein
MVPGMLICIARHPKVRASVGDPEKAPHSCFRARHAGSPNLTIPPAAFPVCRRRHGTATSTPTTDSHRSFAPQSSNESVDAALVIALQHFPKAGPFYKQPDPISRFGRLLAERGHTDITRGPYQRLRASRMDGQRLREASVLDPRQQRLNETRRCGVLEGLPLGRDILSKVGEHPHAQLDRVLRVEGNPCHPGDRIAV